MSGPMKVVESGISIPVEESPNHQPCPCQALSLFTLHILPYLHLPLINFRQRRRCLQLRYIRAKFTQYDPLHSCFYRRIDDRFMRSDFVNGGHIDDCILIFESCDELVKGIRVGDAVDLDVRRERSLGRRAGEDFDVARKSGVGVERGENGGTEVAGGL